MRSTQPVPTSSRWLATRLPRGRLLCARRERPCDRRADERG